MDLDFLYKLNRAPHQGEFGELFMGIVNIWRYADVFSYERHQNQGASRFLTTNAPSEFIYDKKRFCHRNLGYYFQNSKAIKARDMSGFFADFHVSQSHREFFKSKMDDRIWVTGLVAALITSTNRYRFEDLLARTGEKQAAIDKYVNQTMDYLSQYVIDIELTGSIFRLIFKFERNAVASYDAPQFDLMAF